jgi:predicted component of type VI protein secretion system
LIQLQILSGKQAGSDVVVRRFPFVFGRGGDVNHKVDDPGVWDRHVEIAFDRKTGFRFTAQPNATTIVNGEPAADGVLRNGDVIEIGSVRLRFWLARSEQKTLRLREALTWTSLFVLFGAQIALICWLLQ